MRSSKGSKVKKGQKVSEEIPCFFLFNPFEPLKPFEHLEPLLS